MEAGKDRRQQMLLDNGIDPNAGEWFNQQKWLNVFKDIYDKFGEMNLFLIGKAIIDSAQFPPIENLEDGLRAIDVAYHMNHRLNGKIMFDVDTGKMMEGIGHYKLVEFNTDEKYAVMVCDNPYPSKFDEGIISQIARKFKPTHTLERVKVDSTKESRKKGGNSCTYIINW
jgi:hypothetical protein